MLNVFYKDFIKGDIDLIKYSYISKNRYDDDWFSFLRSLSQTSLSLYNFGIEINENFKILKNNKRYKRQFNVYNDLFESKLKKAVFTENPRDTLEEQYINVHKEAHNVIKQLIYDSDSDDNEVIFKINYFHYLKFLLFDFVNNDKRLECTFLKYKADNAVKKKFVSSLKNIQKNIIKISKESAFKQDGYQKIYKQLLELPINNFIDNFENDIIENEVNVDRQNPSSFYTWYFREKKYENSTIDPISRYYSFILWKIGFLSKDRIKNTTNTQDIQDLFSELDKYLTKMIQDFSKYVGIELLNKLFENDIDFISGYILSEFLNYDKYIKSFEVSNKDFLKSFYIHGTTQDAKQIENMDIKTNDFLNLSDKLIDSGDANELRGPWKFDRFLENSDKNDILILMSSIVYFYGTKNYGLFISILKAGSLLGHLSNIVLNRNTPIMFYKSYPYINIFPSTINIQDFLQRNNNILFFDESYKTGHTYLLSKSYLKRKVHKLQNDVFSLARVKNYSNSRKLNKFNYIFEFDIEQYMNNRSAKDSIQLSSSLLSGQKNISINENAIKNYFQDLESRKEEYFKKFILSDNEELLDNTRILSNTYILFELIKFFDEKIGNTEDYNLIFNTDEGYILAYTFLMYSKFIYPKRQITINNDVTEQLKSIYFDIEINTGYTLSKINNSKNIDYFCIITADKNFIDSHKGKVKFIMSYDLKKIYEQENRQS